MNLKNNVKITQINTKYNIIRNQAKHQTYPESEDLSLLLVALDTRGQNLGTWCDERRLKAIKMINSTKTQFHNSDFNIAILTLALNQNS